jgi:hypothetical protein
MAKNIPITARVSKGLFGQKVSEPVLNVGQAGVSANNATKNTPSPAKQMNNPASKKEESTSSYQKGGDMFGVYKAPGTSTFIKGTPAGTANMDALNKQLINRPDLEGHGLRNPKARAAANKAKAEAKAKDAASGTPDRMEPGEDVVGTAKGELYTKDKGDAQTAYDRRGNIRNIKNLTGQEKRNDMRRLRQGGLTDDKGNVIKKGTKEYKDKKAEIKLKKRTDRADVITSEIENSKNQSKQNIKANRLGGYSKKDVLADERKITAGDKTITQQQTDFDNELKTKAEISQTKSDDVKAAEATKTENKKTEAPKTSTSQMSADDDPSTMPTDVKTTAGKRANGFFAKKSPLKMKYFK